MKPVLRRPIPTCYGCGAPLNPGDRFYLNPAGLPVCLWCQARLPPLTQPGSRPLYLVPDTLDTVTELAQAYALIEELTARLYADRPTADPPAPDTLSTAAVGRSNH